MKALKIVVGIVLALVVITAVGTFFLYQNIEGLAERAIEQLGSDVTQTQVNVDGVKLELGNGRGEISGLSVSNPEPFSNNPALEVETVALQIEPTTVRDPVIVLNEVLVDGANLRVEHQGVAKTNIKALLDNIRASTQGDAPAPEDEPGADKRFMVENLRFTNLTMDIVSPQIDNRTVELSDIERTNLGTREQGLTARELALAIAQPLIDQARERVEDELKGRARDAVEERLNDALSDEDREKANRLRSLIN